MLIVVAALGLLQATTGAAAPSDDAFRAALLDKAPAARIVSIDISSSRGGGLACGTAIIGDVVEPFAVVFRAHESLPVVTMVLPDGRQVPPLRHAEPWRVIVQAPYRASSGTFAGSAHSALQWDALNRRGALSVCPDLTPPEGVIWTTEVGPDPALSPEQRERARRLAELSTDLIFGPDRPSEASDH